MGRRLTRAVARRRGPSARRVLRVVQALAALTFVVALLAGRERSGQRFLFCTMMQEIVDGCCCGTKRPDREAAVQRSCCCETRAIGLVPEASPANATELAAGAPALAVAADDRPVPAVERRTVAPSSLRTLGRATGPPLDARQARARLMVFLV